MVKTENKIPKVPEGAHRKGLGGEKRHGDAAIAFCLAWFATLQDSVVIEFDSAGPRECSAGNLADYYGG